MAFAEPVVLFATERNIDLWEVSIAVDGHIAVVHPVAALLFRS